MTYHKRLSASSFSRLAMCPGSAALCDIAPPRPRTKYSREGDNVHYAASLLIAEPTRNVVGVHCPDTGDYLDREHVANALTYVHECLCYKTGASWVGIEQTLDGTWLHPDLGGTPDFAALKNEELVVIDAKNGYEPADADLQLMVYAVLVYGYLQLTRPDLRISGITQIVVQPNCKDPQARYVKKHAADGPRFFEEARAAVGEIIVASEDPNAKRVPGDHCKYCAGAALCPENKHRVSLAAAEVFDRQSEIGQLSGEALSAEMGQLDELKTIVSERYKAVHAHAYHLADKMGQEIRGYKLVDDRGNNAWTDEETAAATLRAFGVRDENMLTLRSYAQLSKLVPDGVLDPFTHRPLRGVKLVESSGRGAPAMSTINKWFSH